MKLLVIGSGMMGSAAAYDMARQPEVHSVTLADANARLARDVAARINRIHGDKKVRAATLHASDEKSAARVMKGHDAALSAVPYFLNLGLTRAAIAARCHFADLGGNNTVVRQELALAGKAGKAGVAIAPDCGLSPGMASILGGELVRRLGDAPTHSSSMSVDCPRNQCPRFTTNLSSQSKVSSTNTWSLRASFAAANSPPSKRSRRV